MTSAIDSMIQGIIQDNKDYILENDQTVAEYIFAGGVDESILSIFYSEDDIDKIGAGYTPEEKSARKRIQKEISDYIRLHYDFKPAIGN